MHSIHYMLSSQAGLWLDAMKALNHVIGHQWVGDTPGSGRKKRRTHRGVNCKQGEEMGRVDCT